jgi:hypothetical protein
MAREASLNDSVEGGIHQGAAVEPVTRQRSFGFALRAVIRTVAIGIGDLVEVMLHRAGKWICIESLPGSVKTPGLVSRGLAGAR